ncbi:mRNA turnover protein 4 [Hypoxylon rubiginosum]|uniref:mRNA turnover protein 4 n=1 Tax=Hypoxylon rubiginosum TaxID=110542 RepID=A0ACB9YS79_9PEZI|nr:mRNA turnover protein 4 [Hypoxylon rubiginosum]
MPKSKRSKVVHMTNVNKKTREHKERLFENIRECVPQYQHCFVFSIDNMRNTYLKNVRQELSDSRIFFGKTKLMARALGHGPEDSYADNIYKLTPYLHGTVGLIFTNQQPEQLLPFLENLAADKVDFARAGATATRDFIVPYGTVSATGGEVPAEHDVPIGHTLEPELRRLGMPVRMVKGRVVLEEGPEGGDAGEGYVVCREGDVLDSRQTRLLKLFSVCLSEFKIKVLAYWSAATSEVTAVDPDAMGGVEGGNDEGSD